MFINVMLANRSPMRVAKRGLGRVTYAKKKTLCRRRPARCFSAQVISGPKGQQLSGGRYFRVAKIHQ